MAFGTFLFFQRLGRAKSVDTLTKKTRLEDTVPVRRAKAAGMGEKDILDLLAMVAITTGGSQPALPPSAVESILPKGYTAKSLQGFSTATGGAKPTGELSGRDLLEVIKCDVAIDVAGIRPLSSFNYISAKFVLLMLFAKIEDSLKEARNAAYVETFETPGPWSKHKRVALTALALREEDEECLKIMAEEFDKHRTGFMDYIYWEDLDTSMEEQSPSKPGPEVPEACVVM